MSRAQRINNTDRIAYRQLRINDGIGLMDEDLDVSYLTKVDQIWNNMTRRMKVERNHFFKN